MRSGTQSIAAGVFLALVVAVIFYLATAPDYVPAAPVFVEPEPEPVSPTPPPVETPEVSAAVEPRGAPRVRGPAGNPREPLRLEPQSLGNYGSIEGVVTRVTVPAPRVTVTAMPDAASGDTTTVTAITDSRGRFKLESVPAGLASLSITGTGLPHELRRDVLVHSERTSSVEIKLPEEAGMVEGVIYAGGAALAATIEITTHGEDMRQSRKIDAPDGHYAAEGLLPGVMDVVVTVEHPPGERRVKTDSFPLLPGQYLVKDYSFSAPALVSGYISGIEGTRAAVIALHGAVQPDETFQSPHDVADRLARSTGPSAEGYYVITGLEPGVYTIIVFAQQAGGASAQLSEYAYEIIEVVEEAVIELNFDIQR